VNYYTQILENVKVGNVVDEENAREYNSPINPIKI
jgi:hypothetical protein